MDDAGPCEWRAWEGFVIDQLLSAIRLADPGAQGWFWRTATGVEIDLVVESRGRLLPFEVKLHSAPDARDVAGLRKGMTDLGLSRGFVVYPGRERYSLGGGVVAVPAQQLISGTSELARLTRPPR